MRYSQPVLFCHFLESTLIVQSWSHRMLGGLRLGSPLFDQLAFCLIHLFLDLRGILHEWLPTFVGLVLISVIASIVVRCNGHLLAQRRVFDRLGLEVLRYGVDVATLLLILLRDCSFDSGPVLLTIGLVGVVRRRWAS